MALSLEIVSPEKLLLSRTVDMVVIPAAEGDMGVLEGHSPMIVTLRGGSISIYEGDRVAEYLYEQAKLVPQPSAQNAAR
jgi:F-type H+-transporting ATPase subunit epsilon